VTSKGGTGERNGDIADRFHYARSGRLEPFTRLALGFCALPKQPRRLEADSMRKTMFVQATKKLHLEEVDEKRDWVYCKRR
jgi:hypothetical protein